MLAVIAIRRTIGNLINVNPVWTYDMQTLPMTVKDSIPTNIVEASDTLNVLLLGRVMPTGSDRWDVCDAMGLTDALDAVSGMVEAWCGWGGRKGDTYAATYPLVESWIANIFG